MHSSFQECWEYDLIEHCVYLHTCMHTHVQNIIHEHWHTFQIIAILLSNRFYLIDRTNKVQGVQMLNKI